MKLLQARRLEGSGDLIYNLITFMYNYVQLDKKVTNIDGPKRVFLLDGGFTFLSLELFSNYKKMVLEYNHHLGT